MIFYACSNDFNPSAFGLPGTLKSTACLNFFCSCRDSKLTNVEGGGLGILDKFDSVSTSLTGGNLPMPSAAAKEAPVMSSPLFSMT